MRGTKLKDDMMVKVLIYSSKEIFDKASYEGRAEAHVIAYNMGNNKYQIVKNRIETHHVPLDKSEVYDFQLKRHIQKLETDEFNAELKRLNPSRFV